MVIAAHLFLPDEKMTRNRPPGSSWPCQRPVLVLRGESGLVRSDGPFAAASC